MIEKLLRTFLSALLVMIFSTSLIAQRSTVIQESDGQAYYMHTVQKGQTLYALAKLYQCDINLITAANPGTDAGIQDGAVIKIPAVGVKVKGKPADVTGTDRKFLTHAVEKKETLYSISRQYNIDINDLIAANPGSDQGVKKGQELRIPIKQEKPKVVPADKTTHTVQPGETMFGIAKTYNITVEDLQRANDGLKKGLLAGEDIFIPVNIGPQVPAGMHDNKTVRDVVIKGEVFQDTYDIALMLPFYATYSDTMEYRENRMRDVAIQMYRGAMMAADTLESQGLHARIHVYDVLDSKSMITDVIAKEEMKEMDVVIGPTFRETLADVSVWGAANGVHIAVPVQQPNKVLLGSPNMSKMVPGAATQWMSIARYIYSKYPDANLVIIDSKNIDDRRSVDAFREEWKRISGDSIQRVVVVADAASFSVKDKFLAGKKNIVIAPTSDKKVVGTLFRVLGDGDITVYGNENWDDLDVINVANRNKYKVHFPQTVFIDYAQPEVQRWIENYRKRFKSEPGKYSFIGYDALMLYGTGLKKFGRAFPNHLNEIDPPVYATGFDFFKTSNESGFENQYVIIVGTNNFELIREN